MAPELGTAVATEADLTKWALVGIAIGAAVFLFGKHVVGTLAKAMWLAGALVVGQIVISNNQVLLGMFETGKSIIPSPANQQLICELYDKRDDVSDLLCRSGLKGTILSND